MIGELIRDLVIELDKLLIPEDLNFILDFQIKNLNLSAEIGRNAIKYDERAGKFLGDQILSAIINSAASIFYDWDDYLFAGHTGHSSVFVSQALTSDPEKVMKSVLIGNEIGGRIGILFLFGPLNGQMMSYIHGIVSCVLTEYIQGDISNIPKRFSYYVSNPNFLTYGGFMGGNTKIFSSVFPIVSGMLASVFELGSNNFSEESFLDLFSFSSIKSITKKLEEIFSPSFFLTKTLMVKKYPACAYVIPQVECALSIRDKIEDIEGDINIEKIKKIKIEYSAINQILDKIASRFFTENFSNRIPLQFSTPLAFSLALLGKGDFNCRSYSNFIKSDLFRIYGKIQTVHNQSFTVKIIKNVLKHFHFIPIPNISKIGNILLEIVKDRVILDISPKFVFDLILNLQGDRANPDDFQFVFPTRVQVFYGDSVFEEEKESHSFLARKMKKEEVEDFLKFKALCKL